MMLRDAGPKEKAILAATTVVGTVFILVADSRMAGMVLYIALSSLASMFAVMYWTRSNWRKTAPGRALMYINLLLAALGVWVTLSIWLTDSIPFRDEVRSVLLLGFVVVMVNLILTLARVQNSTARDLKAFKRDLPDLFEENQ